MTQQELAEKLQLKGIDLTSKEISKIENNKRLVQDFELFAFAKIFEQKVRSLVQIIADSLYNLVYFVCLDYSNVLVLLLSSLQHLPLLQFYLLFHLLKTLQFRLIYDYLVLFLFLSFVNKGTDFLFISLHHFVLFHFFVSTLHLILLAQ